MNNENEPRVLGRGQFSVVYLARDSQASRFKNLVALKVQSRNSEKETNDSFAEAIQIKSLHHPNIVTLIDAFLIFSPHLRVGLALEYCAEGDLGSYLRRMKTGAVPNSSKVHPLRGL